MGGMQKFLVILGLILLLMGLAWPLLGRILGRLPGDIHIGGEGWSLHILLGTSIVLSIVLTVVVNLLLAWLGK